MWIDLFWAIVAAAVVGLAVGMLKRPRKYVVEFWRAGRGRPYSKLHAVLGAHWPAVWLKVPSVEGPRIAWQCQMIVTNGGTRNDAPVRGELWWRRRPTSFVCPLKPATPGPGTITDLAPGDAATLMVNAWTLLLPADGEPSGDLVADLVLFDRYGGSHKTRKVKFQPTNHADNHSSLNGATGLVTSWEDSGSDQGSLET